MTTATPSTTASGPAGAFTQILSLALDLITTKLQRNVGQLAERFSGATDDAVDMAATEAESSLDEAGSTGGATQQAGARGLLAGLRGKNPVWAAVKGAWSGGGATVRAAIVTAVVAMVVMLLVSPVLLLVFLLSLLVIGAVMKVSSSDDED